VDLSLVGYDGGPYVRDSEHSMEGKKRARKSKPRPEQ
jgi:hypothetical protein